MNSAKSQDTKSIHINHFHFYILTTKSQKRKQGISPVHHCHKKNEISRNELTWGTKQLLRKSWDTDERNQRWQTDGERVHVPEEMTVPPNAIYIQCDPCQITNGIFHRTRTKLSQFIWKHKRPQIAKAILRKKNGPGGIRLPGFIQAILQSYSHQNSTGTKTEI